MRRFNKHLLITIFILSIMLVSTAFAGENDYRLVREMIYKNAKKTDVKTGFVEIMIGTKDTVQYQEDGDIVINPAPDKLSEDEFGNIYAYFDLAGLQAGSEFRVRIQRDVSLDTYEKEISVRTDSASGVEEVYYEPQKKVESDADEIVSKAKELTYELSSDYKKALAIFEYVNTQMDYSTSDSYANKGALSAMKNKKGVCEEFSTLYVAMCRAVGIPARLVEGYKFNLKDDTLKNDDAKEGYDLVSHVWSEICLDGYGWVPVETCVIYAPGGERIAYTDSFCRMEDIEYIATGIYNSNRPNRKMQSVIETSFNESLVKLEDAEIEEHEFDDVGENYSWCKDAIDNLYNLGIVNGYTYREYAPSKNISRIEFMAMLSRCLEYMNYYPAKGGLVYYHLDYDQSHWSKPEYDYLMRCYQTVDPSDIVSMGYYTLSGVFGSSIQMDKPITREEVVALMDCFLDETYINNAFTDTETSRFKSSILKAYDSGLINGYEDGSFRPTNPITRAEMAVILNRYISRYKYVI